jgi:hypothetical protein
MAVGDITYTNPGGELATSAFASGKLIVDADAAANIICGFQPTRVELLLVDAGATANTMMIWNNAMPDGTYALISDGGDLTFPTTLGVTVYSGASGEGFTIPANQTGAADSDVIYWTAWR